MKTKKAKTEDALGAERNATAPENDSQVGGLHGELHLHRTPLVWRDRESLDLA